MNANADALSRNPVEYKKVKKVTPTKIQARTTKRNQNKVKRGYPRRRKFLKIIKLAPPMMNPVKIQRSSKD